MALTYEIRLGKVGEDDVIKQDEVTKFFLENIKVDNRRQNLNGCIDVTCSDQVVQINSTIPLSKVYMKYLIKKFIKKRQLRDWVHVVSDSNISYMLEFYNTEEVPAE